MDSGKRILNFKSLSILNHPAFDLSVVNKVFYGWTKQIAKMLIVPNVWSVDEECRGRAWILKSEKI